MNTEDLKIKGMTFARVRRVTYERGSDSAEAILFEPADGSAWAMYHDQDCCEAVKIEDVTGNLADLEGVPLVEAYASSNAGDTEWGGSCTWTFYHFRTAKGDVCVRWYGESNGHYSESAELRSVAGMEWMFEDAKDSEGTNP